MEKSEIFKIPQVHNTMRYYVNGEYRGDVTPEQLNVIRVKVIKYIHDTGDTSILNDLYFIGHESSNTSMGDEVKITIEDENGNLSDIPWELDNVRRSMLALITIKNPDADEDRINARVNAVIGD